MAYDLTAIDPAPEARREGNRLLRQLGADSAIDRLCQLLSDTAGAIVDQIAAGTPIDPAPYRKLVLKGERRAMIALFKDAGLTNAQARALRDALVAAGFEFTLKD